MVLRAVGASLVGALATGLSAVARAIGGDAATPAPGADDKADKKADEKPEEKPAAPAPPANPFADRNAQALSTLTWLVGALGAVATLMVAGTQLTGIGALSWEDDRPRLLAAGISVLVAVVLVVVAVGLLTWATMPSALSDLERLDRLAADGPTGDVASSVARDSSYHRGTGSLAALLTELAAARADLYDARTRLRTAQLAAAREADGDARTALDARVTRLTAEVAVLGARNDDLRLGARAAAQLDHHLRTRTRAVRVSWWVLATSTVVAVCLVVLAWAANPPEETDDAATALPPDPVAAVLVLASDDAVWGDRLGADCAAAARDDGVPVVALASDDEAVTVLVVPQGDCTDPAQVTVPRDEGTVTTDTVDLDAG